MKAKHFPCENIKDKTKIKVFSNTINFAQNSTHVLVYFDDLKRPYYDFYAEIQIQEENQFNTHVFDVEIPQNTHTANIILIAINDYNLDEVSVTAS